MRGLFHNDAFTRGDPALRGLFVGLVSCGKAKRRARSRARDLYTGPFASACIRWAARNCKDWRILSAKHGVLRPDEVVEPYEMSLASLSKAGREEWGRAATERLEEEFPGRAFLCLAGGLYRAGLSLPALACPLAGLGGFGRQMAWLKRNPALTEEMVRAWR